MEAAQHDESLRQIIHNRAPAVRSPTGLTCSLPALPLRWRGNLSHCYHRLSSQIPRQRPTHQPLGLA
jgi:hypothetical protein